MMTRKWYWIAPIALVAIVMVLAGCPTPLGPDGGVGSGGGGDPAPDPDPPPVTYSVFYDANGADSGNVPTDNAEYEAGATVTVAANTGSLARDGFAFLGWNTNTGGTGTNYSPGSTFVIGSANVTLFARWVEDTVQIWTVSFVSNGGSTVSPQDVVDGETATRPAPDPTRTGYSFGQWYSESELLTPWDFGTGVSADTTLYAGWAADEYQVVFNANGGSGTMIPQTIRFGESAELTTNAFTRFGHSFGAWNTAANGSGDAYANGAEFDMTTEGVTLYAQWTPNVYDVVFDKNADDATGAMSNQAITFGTAANLSMILFEREGFSFVRWTTESDGGGDAYSDGASFPMNTGGATLYAQWIEDDPEPPASVTVAVSDLDPSYNGFFAAIFVYEAGYEFPGDGLTAFAEAVGIGTENLDGDGVVVAAGSTDPILIERVERDDDETGWGPFVGDPGTQYDLYLVLFDDMDTPAPTLVHGGVDGIEPLLTLTGGFGQTLTVSASGAGYLDVPMVGEVIQFSVSGIDEAYEGWLVYVNVFAGGAIPVEENLLAVGVAFSEGADTIVDGSAGPLIALEYDTFDFWLGLVGSEYDLYLSVVSENGEYVLLFVMTADDGPLATIQGGVAQEVEIIVPADANYADGSWWGDV